MKKVVSLSLLTVLSLSAVGCGTRTETFNPVLPAGTDVFQSTAKEGVINGEFIVKFKKSARNASAILTSAGAVSIKSIGGKNSGVQLVKVNESNSQNVLSSLKRNPSVEYVEPNYTITVPKTWKASNTGDDDTQAFPNDPMFDKQYAHKVMDSQKGWALAKKTSDAVIAILDTGIDGEHPDLKAKLLPGYDAYGLGKEYVDKQGHGTHCAGIASAITNNSVGVAGVAPDAKLLSVKVLQDSGSGTYAAVADGIRWAAENKDIDVISMSLGGSGASAAIEDAVKLALQNGKVVVAAMGNNGSYRPSYPAAIDGVFAVGATDSSDKLASFSQKGAHINVSAPGVGIMSTFPTYSSGMPAKDYGSISGTSMATPAVAGLAGLLKGVNKSLTSAQIEKIMEETADDLGDAGFDQLYGAGRINVGKAVAKALGRR